VSTAKSIININLIVVVTLLVGVANNIAIAGFFGLTRLVDAYYAAYVLPALMMDMFVDFLGKNFLPIFSMLKKEGDEQADKLTSSLINIIFVMAAMMALLLSFYAKDIFSLMLPGFSDSEVADTANMFWIMTPAVMLMAVNTFHIYVCQYDGKYVHVVLCKLALPITLLCSIIFGRDALGEYSLPVGLLLGNIIVFILLARTADYRYQFIADYKSTHIKQIFVNSGILISTGVIARSRIIIERYFGSMMDAGAISSMAMADRLCTPLYHSATIGVRMIAFTKASKLYADQQLKQIGLLHNDALIAVFLMVVPMVVWIAYHSSQIVALLFMRGNFTSDMHYLVTMALIGLLPSVIAKSTSQIMMNVFYVTNKVAVPAILGIAGTILYLICVYPLSDAYGVLGLAMAQSVSFVVVFFVLILLLSRELEWFSAGKVLGKLFYYLAVSGISVWAAASIAGLIEGYYVFQLIVSFMIASLLYIALLAVTKDYGFLYLKEKLFHKRHLTT